MNDIKKIKNVSEVKIKYFKRLIPDIEKSIENYELACEVCDGRKFIEFLDGYGDPDCEQCYYCDGTGIEKQEKLKSEFLLRIYDENFYLSKVFIENSKELYVLRNKDIEENLDKYINCLVKNNGFINFYYVDNKLEHYQYIDMAKDVGPVAYSQPIFISSNKEYFKEALKEYEEYLARKD